MCFLKYKNFLIYIFTRNRIFSFFLVMLLETTGEYIDAYKYADCELLFARVKAAAQNHAEVYKTRETTQKSALQ